MSLIGVMLALLAWRAARSTFLDDRPDHADGPVTKNAILLVDFAKLRADEGASVPERCCRQGQIRMRPIIMTTAGQVFGMLPLALALNDGGELRAPMGRAIIGGVITSTLLTLVVVPVLWSVLVGGSSASRRSRGARSESRAQTSPAR